MKLQDLRKQDLIDVRSPKEFAKGHVPGARNLPLFDDEERARVGTTYKQTGRLEAARIGLEIVAPKINQYCGLKGPLHLYCWRGGLRSESVRALLNLIGVENELIAGGYKGYRKQVREELDKTRCFLVIGGYTGSGKTELLADLRAKGEQALDLEGLANHRGSSFGMIGQPPQPTQEQFENMIASELSSFDDRPIFIEDESRMIGTLANPLFEQMMQSSIHLVEKSFEKRLDRLCSEYGGLPKEELIKATKRLNKRLGSERTNQAVESIQKGKLRAAASILLHYYDKAYEHGLTRRSHAAL